MESTTADYLVGVPIGQGSFGTVLHCQHKATRQQVAIKVVPKITLRRYPQQLQAVLQEQKLLRQQLSECPYVVTLLASFHDEECLYLVMECCEGGDLEHVMRHGRRLGDWPVRAAVLGRELMCALEALHSQKIVHVDLKPSNILFTKQGRLVLADLGSAVDLNQSQEVNNSLRGTAEYAAPELIRAEQTITTAVDLWSYGCILCALWTGESPFHADSEVLVLQRVLDYVSLKDNARQSVVSTSVPNSWRDLILLLLHPYPSHRSAADGDFSSIRLLWNSIIGDQVLPGFSYVEPSWLIESRQSNMKDGSIGWAAFLID